MSRASKQQAKHSKSQDLLRLWGMEGVCKGAFLGGLNTDIRNTSLKYLKRRKPPKSPFSAWTIEWLNELRILLISNDGDTTTTRALLARSFVGLSRCFSKLKIRFLEFGWRDDVTIETLLMRTTTTNNKNNFCCFYGYLKGKLTHTHTRH